MARISAAQKRIHGAALRLFAERGSTEVSVSALAEAAGVARGTVYNNLGSTEDLLHRVAAQLAADMHRRVAASYRGAEDAGERLAIGVRLYVRRAHEEPDWGRFLLKFGMGTDALRDIWMGPPVQDLELGLARGRYRFRAEQLAGAMGLVAGTTLTAILLVLQGHRTWREAGADAAELVLRALGVPPEEALRLATMPLPDLA
jgi:AcrR family transcriptional regulator